MTEDIKIGNKQVIWRFEILDAGKLKENPWNPNEMDKITMERLKRSIQENGFIQPVVVAPDGDGKFLIVDGHHRFKVLQELGYDKVPVVIVEGLDNVQRYTATYVLNQVRGAINADKVKEMVKAFIAQYGDSVKDKLSEYMLIQRETLDKLIKESSKRMESVASAVKDRSEVERAVENVNKSLQRQTQQSVGAKKSLPVPATLEMREFTVMLSADDYRLVLDALKSINPNDIGKALVELVKRFVNYE